MSCNAHNRAGSTATYPGERVPTVCVVDPAPADYHAWTGPADAGLVRLIFATSAELALRAVGNQPVDLWVINTKLPGLSGGDLCGLVRNQSARTAVYLVADDYSPTEELAAWQARPTLFGCKGSHEGWLAQWLELRRTHASATAAKCSPSLAV